MERPVREGRGKRKADSLELALAAEAEHKAKRVKLPAKPKPLLAPAPVKVTKTKVAAPKAPALTPAQAAKSEAKAIILAKKAIVKKKKDDLEKLKLAKLKVKSDKKAAKAAAEAAFIKPYLKQAEGCFKASESGRITVSRVKSEYRLNESDLSSLKYDSAPNPHYNNAAPMRLYDISEVARVCKEKYQTKEKLARKFAMRDAPKKPRKPRARAVRDYDDDNDDDDRETNDLVCDGCGETAAMECTMERCCHCCNDASCFRHRGFF